MPLANRTRTYMYLTRQLHVSHCTRTPNEICFPPDHLTTLPPTLLPAGVTQSHNIEHFSDLCLNTLKNDKSSFLQLRSRVRYTHNSRESRSLHVHALPIECDQSARRYCKPARNAHVRMSMGCTSNPSLSRTPPSRVLFSIDKVKYSPCSNS